MDEPTAADIIRTIAVCKDSKTWAEKNKRLPSLVFHIFRLLLRIYVHKQNELYVRAIQGIYVNIYIP